MNNLQAARMARDYSTREIAKIIGVSQGMVSNYENGKSPIRPDQLIKLADLYGCTTDFLLGRIDKKHDEAIMKLLTLLDLKPDDDADTMNESGFSSNDRRVFNLYMKLDTDDKDLIERMIIRLSRERAS